MAAKKILIVGAGFAGLSAARSLARHHAPQDLEITIVDRNNYHLFQPLLYQVATAGLSPADIAFPIRSVFTNSPNVSVFLGEVERIDLAAQKVHLKTLEGLDYDFLILACGAGQNYFGHPEWEKYSPSLKTLGQSIDIRRKILLSFEEAEKQTDTSLHQEYLTFVVIGGGPTGVELAGAISEISRFTLEKDFRNIDPASAKIILLEAGPRILASFSPRLSDRATKDLERLGVEITTGTRVTQIFDDGVQLGDRKIKARTVLWAAGVKPTHIPMANVQLDPAGRVMVGPELTLPGVANVFVLGDQARVLGGDGQALPGLAPVAMQEGRWAAKNILLALEQKPMRPFVYNDKGQMATVGRRKAVVQVGKIQFSGVFAWLAWLFIHIFYLIGFKNRLSVFFQWAWSYLTFKRGARLIT